MSMNYVRSYFAITFLFSSCAMHAADTEEQESAIVKKFNELLSAPLSELRGFSNIAPSLFGYEEGIQKRESTRIKAKLPLRNALKIRR